MIEYLRTVYHVAQILSIPIVGASARWLYKWRKQGMEERVLSTFHNTDNDGGWQSAHGVVGELYLKAALSDAPGFFPPKLSGWRSLKHWLRVSPYRFRHAVRRSFVLPSWEQADKILRELWKRNLLVRAGWQHTDTEFYRLRN
jgi:hypothetical protein